MEDRLIVTASPHIRDTSTTRGLMGNVVIALLPAVLRRGKNASKATVAKHATVQEYRASTGFECLLGWLYLQGRNDRIEELFNAMWDGYKPE